MLPITKNCIFITIVAGFSASPANAQSQGDAAISQSQLDAVIACRAIADQVERVSCYDRATAELATSLETGELLVLDREERKEAQRGVFGFSMRGLEFLESEGDDSANVTTLESSITAVQSFGRNSYQITIADNDAVWEIRNAPMRFFPPKAGQKVEFEKAALSSYWVRVNGQLGVKGTRIR